MMREHVGSRRAGGLLGSLVIHVVVLGVALSIGPQVRDFVWEGSTDGATGGGRTAHAALLGTSRVGAAPSQPTRLQQLGVAMSSNAPPAPAVRMRLAIERVLDHLWQSTLFAIPVALLAVVLRRNRARIRYALWLAASVKFVVPMALVIALGRLVSPSIVDRLAAHPVVAELREPLASISMPALWPASAALDPARHDSSGLAVAAVWLGGFALIAALRWRQWRRLKAVVDVGEPLDLAGIDIPASVDVRSATGRMEPGVVGWQQPVLLMPADIDRLLTPTEVEAIVAHELCHVRRFDNLTGAIHMIVEALFWFHPLVWWIGGRLMTERERACDEHVLRTVGHPVSYAQGIVTICKRYVPSPLACVSGVSTSHVGRRIEAILANQVGERIGPLKRMVVGATIVLVVVVPPSVGAMNAPWLPGVPFRTVAMAAAAPPVRVSPTPAAAPKTTLALVMARAGGEPGPQLRRSRRTDCDAAPNADPPTRIPAAVGRRPAGSPRTASRRPSWRHSSRARSTTPSSIGPAWRAVSTCV
jgi:beta-lactamase regulating signal transducer with metallopeptidase domain